MHAQGQPPSPYETVFVRGSDLALIRAIRTEIHGGDDAAPANDDARIAWLYSDNPAGPATIMALRTTAGRWVGMVAIVPRSLNVGTERRIGAYLCDFYVHPSHRTVLPAMQLQRTAKTWLAESGTLTYAIPNGRSLPIFKRLGADQILKRWRWARPIRTLKFVERRGIALPRLVAPVIDLSYLALDRWRALSSGGVRAEWLSTIDDRFDELWAASPKAGLLLGDRSSSYIRWRFMSEPGHDNRVLAFFRTSSGALEGYVVGKVVRDEFVIRDVLMPRSSLIDQMLAKMLQQVRGLGVASVGLRLTGNSPITASLHRLGFRGRDPESIFVRNHSGQDIDDWHFTNADEDV